MKIKFNATYASKSGCDGPLAQPEKIYLVCSVVFSNSDAASLDASLCTAGIFNLKPNKMKASDLYDGVVVKPYNGWSDSKLSTETVKIQTSMTGNPRFPTPVPNMEDFASVVGEYGLALAKAGTRDMNAVAAKNARRVELIAMCVQLGYSVSNTAEGDVEALVSTSLPLRKKRQPVVLTPPSNLRIVNGINPGELDLRVDSMKGASTFGFEYTEDPPTEESVWVKTMCSTSRCTIKNLQPGKKYWFRTFVIGTKGRMVMGETLLSPYVQ